MARKTLLGELKEFVEEQTKGVGVVSNLHGIVESSDQATAEVKSQKWFVAAVAAATPPDMRGILSLFTYEKPGFDPVDADSTGLAQYPTSGAAIPPLTAVLFYGAISLPNSRKFDIRLRGEGSTVSLYLDGSQIGTASDTLKVSPEVSAGYHVLTGIVHGAIKPVTIEVSTDLEVVRSEVNPTAPVWLQFPTAYAIEPLSGVVNARMQWSNDAHASEWNLYRAPTTLLGTVVGTPTLTGDNNISFQVAGPVTLVTGDVIFTDYFEAGVVFSVTSGSPSTIVVTPILETDLTLTNWTGIRTFSVNPFVPIATIPNAGGDAVIYMDDGLAKNSFYVYKVTSVGPFGLSESAYSTPMGVFANDEDCPAGVNWDVANQPIVTVDGLQATVRFPSPTDPDFAGIRVYGPYATTPPTTFDPSKAIVTQPSSPNKREQVSFRIADATNAALWSNDLSNGVYINAGLGTGTAVLNAIGLKGVASTATTISDTDATAYYDRTQSWTVPNDNATHIVGVWIAKDAVTTRFPEVAMTLGGGTSQSNKVQINTQTGVAVLRVSVGSNPFFVVDGATLGFPGWWLFVVGVVNNSTGNTQLTLNIYPARSNTIGGAVVTATGSIVVGNVDVYLGGTTSPITPIFTTTVAVNEATLNQTYYLATFDAQGNQQPPVAFTSRRTGNVQTAAYGFLYTGPTDPTIECYARITASNATTVTVTVTGRGTGVQVQYVGVTGGATYLSGTAAGTPVIPNGTNNVWVFTRAAINGGAGQAQFRATKNGFQSDDDFVTIEEQGRDTIDIICQASVITTTPTFAIVRVVVADPVSQALTASIAYTQTSNIGAISPASPQTVTPTTSLVASGANFKDFTVPRPLFGTNTGQVIFTATMANRTSDSDSVDIPSLESTLSGTQILSNPNFFGGLTGYGIYDNGSSGKVTESIVVDATAPTPSGQVMRVSVAANATTAPVTSPGFGGFYVGINEDGGVYKPDSYHKNSLITWVIRAKIPTNYSINFASNGYGAEGSVAWQTPQIGTGGFFEYRLLQQIGITGSFSTTGFFYLTNISTYDTLAFTWDVAQCAAYDRNRPATDTVLPTLVLSVIESGGTAKVTATVVDPQNRVRGAGAGVRFTTISGRGAIDGAGVSSAGATAIGTIISPGGVWSTITTPGDVILLPKLPSFVEVDLFGIDANGVYGQLVDHKRLSFGLGNVPITPDIAYTVDGNGNLMATVVVDNDTAYVKCLASKNSPPTAAQLTASGQITVPTGTFSVQVGTGGPPKITLAGLNSGERYFIVAQAFNAVDVPSDVYSLQDVYIVGSDTATPRVTWTATFVSAQTVTFRIQPNRHCAEFEIYIKEYSTDPGNELPIDSAYPTPFDAYVVGTDNGAEAIYRAHPSTDVDIIIPIAGNANYVLMTVVPYDTLARQGPKLTKKAQGNGTAPPLAPTASSIIAGPAQTTVTVNVTMPSIVPPQIRIYKDNVLYSAVATTGATANTTFSLPQIVGLSPSTTYNFSFAGYDNTAQVESNGRQGPLQVTTTAPSGGSGQIPQPLLTAANVTYNAGTETWSFVVDNTASGTPAGVTWHIDRFTAATPFTSFVEVVNGTATTLSFSDPMDSSGGTNYYFTAWGTLPGWTTSLRSNPTTRGTEVATGPVHKTGYGEPSTAPSGTPTVTQGALSHQVTISWTNTNTTDLIYIALERLNGTTWEAAAERSSVAPGTTTLANIGVISINMYYRGRVRYYNSAHNGPWSAYGQSVSPIT
jgi:hypothetical protein